ncbi:MAG: efflux RND transporter permease subunit [Gammaproteobacteria bacterium]|nr:MAG: efflux RND transporter permease subunit [Gammaproteobacteria bacterium]
MNRIIAWFAENHVAANLLMVLIVVAGLVSIPETRKELIPNISLGMVNITVPYPGATPEEVEQAICIRIEENVFDVEGIRQLTSSATEDACNVVAEIEPGYDTRNVMDDIKSRVDTITNFPKNAEQPIIREITIKSIVASIVVAGDVDERSLKYLAEQVRDDLTALPSITQVELMNARPYEISIELSEGDLHQYDLTFDEVANSVRNASLDLPGGVMKTQAGDVLLRTLGQAYWGDQYENLVLRANTDGSRILLSDVANVIDGFQDAEYRGEFNGKPGIMMAVYRVGDQNILQMAEDIRDYVADKQTQLPQGVAIAVWQDRSEFFKSRMELLTRNALTGLLLVFIILVMFLRLSLAFWVSLGIPISFMGGFWLLPVFDGSINMISMFAFILVLGIVVDDAIVVGENIHARHQRGEWGLNGAILGTQEVAKPVIFAVLTSVVAFMPILFLPGSEGQLWMMIPMVVIITLLFSLVECLFVLPAHLATIRTLPNHLHAFGRFQQAFAGRLENFVQQVYRPFLAWALRWRYATVAVFVSAFMVFVAVVAAGWLHLLFFPKVEGDLAVAHVAFAQGTPVETTEQAVERIEAAAEKLKQTLRDETGREQIVNMVSIVGVQSIGRNRTQGAHTGEVTLALAPAEQREYSNTEIVKRWRELVGQISGATQLSYQSTLRDSGPAINIELTGADLNRLSDAADDLKSRLYDYPGLYDIQDTFESGKKEVRLTLKPEAEHFGVTTQLLARQIRQAFYGEEIQRIQRDRDDVRVFVRYPEAQRRSLYFLENMFVRVSGDIEIPLNQVADVHYGVGPAEIKRINRKRVIEVSAQVDESRAVPGQVMEDLRASFLERLEVHYPGVRWDKAGQQKDQDELINAMYVGFMLALLGIYILMAIPFRSYVQPIMVMTAIPFGLIGAILGHMLLGLDISLLSLSGMIAVAGVVVNDNLVLVDYINRNCHAGKPVARAIRDAGVARFRPIILTSLTTFAGLTPLMLERSVQAQFLIPMAVSLAFGVMFATVVSLVLVPASYYILEDIKKRLGFAKPEFISSPDNI